MISLEQTNRRDNIVCEMLSVDKGPVEHVEEPMNNKGSPGKDSTQGVIFTESSDRLRATRN